MAILRFFNEVLDLEIGSNHSFVRSEAAKPFYKFTGGVTPGFGVFKGVVRCNEVDLPGGQFHKVFELTRSEREKKFFINITVPRPECDENASRYPESQPLELIDLSEGAVRVEVLTTIVDVDTEFDENPRQVRKVVSSVVTQPAINFGTCVICGERLAVQGEMRVHLDICLG